jgi:hypothetical protein
LVAEGSLFPKSGISKTFLDLRWDYKELTESSWMNLKIHNQLKFVLLHIFENFQILVFWIKIREVSRITKSTFSSLFLKSTFLFSYDDFFTLELPAEIEWAIILETICWHQSDKEKLKYTFKNIYLCIFLFEIISSVFKNYDFKFYIEKTQFWFERNKNVSDQTKYD